MNTKLRIDSPLPEELENLIQKVIGLAIEVHRTLGPGYIESIYEKAMCYELDKAGIFLRFVI
jgi:GxxExxY protein